MRSNTKSIRLSANRVSMTSSHITQSSAASKSWLSNWREHLFSLAGIARFVAIVSLYVHAISYLIPNSSTTTATTTSNDIAPNRYTSDTTSDITLGEHQSVPSLVFIGFVALQTIECVLRVPEMLKMDTLSGKLQSIGMACLYAILIILFAVPYIRRDIHMRALSRKTFVVPRTN